MAWEKKLEGKNVELNYLGATSEVMYGMVEEVGDKFIVFRPQSQPKRVLFLNPARVIAIKMADKK